MSLLLAAKNRDFSSLKKALLEQDPHLDIDIWPAVKNKDQVTFAVCWNHPGHLLDSFPNLQAVSSLGAGVNHLLNDESLDNEIPISRLITNSLKKDMADYILNAVTNYRLNISTYVDQKRSGKWEQHRSLPKKMAKVGIMGLGEMGIEVARHLTQQDYEVHGWSRSKKEIPGVTCYAGNEALDPFLRSVNILVCLLPLTEATEGILDLDVFKKLENPSYLINVGRGSHLIEEDLIYALDVDELNGACLDVFEKEPLPSNHSFWNRSKIMITPHIAAITPAKEAAKVIIENYKRALSGQKLLYPVDRKKGY